MSCPRIINGSLAGDFWAGAALKAISKTKSKGDNNLIICDGNLKFPDINEKIINLAF